MRFALVFLFSGQRALTLKSSGLLNGAALRVGQGVQCANDAVTLLIFVGHADFGGVLADFGTRTLEQGADKLLKRLACSDVLHGELVRAVLVGDFVDLVPDFSRAGLLIFRALPFTLIFSGMAAALTAGRARPLG